MNLKEIRELIEFLKEQDIAEIELERGDVNVRVKRGVEPVVAAEMRYVAMPMALRRMAPGLVSQLITLFKDTSLASILSIFELLRSARQIYDSPVYNNTLEVLLIVSMMYFLPCYALSLLAQHLEQGPEGRERLGAELGTAAAEPAAPA